MANLFESAGFGKDAPRPLADRLRPQKLADVAAADRALAGVVVALGTEIFTVKMVGSVEEVAAEKANLQAYVKSLRMAE